MDNVARAQAAVFRAVEACGGAYELKRVLEQRGTKISPQAIYQWTVVPIHHARIIAELSGIPLHELRPDIWDRPERAPVEVVELKESDAAP